MKPNLKRAVDKKELSVLDGRIISEIITALENCNQKLLLPLLS